MKLLIKTIICVCFLSSYCFANQTNSEDSGLIPLPQKVYTTLSLKDSALLRCLKQNYPNAGVRNSKQNSFSALNDASSLKPDYEQDLKVSIALYKFVEKETTGFYKDKLLMHHDDGDKEMNMIFSHCMDFYHSKKLNDFVEQLETQHKQWLSKTFGKN